MERQKVYGEIFLPIAGWKKLVDRALVALPTGKLHRAEAAHDGGSWRFDDLSDFFAHEKTEQATVSFYGDSGTTESLRISSVGRQFSWSMSHPDKKTLVDFEHDAEAIVAEYGEPAGATEEALTIFIGHGGKSDWKELKDHLVDKHGHAVESFETGSRAGHTIRDILDSMLTNADLAILVHTPENKRDDGTLDARANVIHETGLFQGYLGWDRVVVIQKEGTNDFSNLAGVHQLRYKLRISEVFGDVLAWIGRESRFS